MTASHGVRVSIIMLTYNRPQFLDRAIGSVVTQCLQSWELIVVHDGPNAEIAGTVQAWTRRDPRIRYFHRSEKGNIANAYNFGIEHARGDFVAILDDDDYWIDDEKLALQVEFLEGHHECVGCGGGMVVVDPHGQELLRYLKREHDADIRRSALIANPMAHSTMLFRARIASEAIRYDETLAGFQDWDLWLRLGRLGQLYNFPRLFTCYTMWPGGSSFNQQVANVRSAVTIVRRHHDAYHGAATAAGVTSLHFLYAHLPTSVRWQLFARLSVLKKRLFGGPALRAAAPAVAAGGPGATRDAVGSVTIEN